MGDGDSAEDCKEEEQQQQQKQKQKHKKNASLAHHTPIPCLRTIYNARTHYLHIDMSHASESKPQ